MYLNSNDGCYRPVQTKHRLRSTTQKPFFDIDIGYKIVPIAKAAVATVLVAFVEC